MRRVAATIFLLSLIHCAARAKLPHRRRPVTLQNWQRRRIGPAFSARIAMASRMNAACRQNGRRVVRRLFGKAAIGTGYAAPAICDGRLFHFARVEGQRTARRASMPRRAPQWKCDYPTDFEDMLGYNNGPRATPVVDGPNVYTYGAEGVLQCVRVADGQMVWRIDTMKDFGVVKNFFGVGSTPLV